MTERYATSMIRSAEEQGLLLCIYLMVDMREDGPDHFEIRLTDLETGTIRQSFTTWEEDQANERFDMLYANNFVTEPEVIDVRDDTAGPASDYSADPLYGAF